LCGRKMFLRTGNNECLLVSAPGNMAGS
jgi:hypothetical protein